MLKRLLILAALAGAAKAGGQEPAAAPLSKQLAGEAPAALAADARSTGRVVRGAILFHQRKLDCGKCHLAAAHTPAIGPDLRKIERPVKDTYLVESLLRPSKVIKKGFATSVVRTTDGRVLTGRIAEQTPQQVTLLDASKLGAAIRLDAKDIAEIKPSDKSTMPDNLVDQLQNRQEFLDLLRYLIELSSGSLGDGSGESPWPEVAGGKPLNDELRGLMWLGELNCGACHDAGNEFPLASRPAPNLAWSSGRLDPAYVQRFLEDPAKVKPGTPMPHVLSSLTPQERDHAARDITYFLRSLSDRYFTRQAPDRIAVPRGRELFHSVGCVACHSPRDENGKQLLAETSVPLGSLEKKYSVESLTELLEDPHAARPAGRMPNLRLSHWEASDLAHYLLASTEVDGGLRFTTYRDAMHQGLDKLAGKEQRAGMTLDFSLEPFADLQNDFAVVFDGFLHIGNEGDYTFYLSCNDAARLTIGGKRLLDLPPRPGDEPQDGKATVRLAPGAHPIQLGYLQLRDRKSLELEIEGPGLPRQAIRHTLLSADGSVPYASSPRAPLFEEFVRAGRMKFRELGCVQCHKLTGLPTEPSSRGSGPPLADVRADEGCLSGKPGAWPQFQLSDEQRRTIRAALARPPGKLGDSDRIALTLTSLRCVRCHQRGELGGVPAERSVHFQTTDLNLGEQGRIPPTLTGAGAKLNPAWMRDVLVNGRSVRPYIKTRMPQYGEDNVGPLIDLLQRADQLPEVEYPRVKDERETRKAGQEIVGNSGLNCVGCHTHKGRRSATMAAVDLTVMAERLQKPWLYHYMRSPQRFSPNTVMPSFWPGGRALRTDLAGGDPDMQLESIWTYLLEGRQSGTPRGLIREPMELVSGDEAVMLRRAYPGIGKRGIGVGYPRQVNLAFDAEQLRLSLLWKGKFADPAGVWTGQGSGNVRPLGERPITLAKGPELDDAETPWEVDNGRPPKHRFLGYQLDELQRPTFVYRFESIEVEDYFVDLADEEEPLLRRTLTLSAPERRPGAAFRVAAAERIERLDDGWFRVGEQLRVRIEAPRAGKVVETLKGQALVIPLEVPAGKSKVVVEYAW